MLLCEFLPGVEERGLFFIFSARFEAMDGCDVSLRRLRTLF